MSTVYKDPLQCGNNLNRCGKPVLSLSASVGPIPATMNGALLQYYESGIFDELRCPQLMNHAVLAVGYGEDTKAYWIIKNSWGTSWGEGGYLRLVRNKNECGIANRSVYPNIK